MIPKIVAVAAPGPAQRYNNPDVKQEDGYPSILKMMTLDRPLMTSSLKRETPCKKQKVGTGLT